MMFLMATDKYDCSTYVFTTAVIFGFPFFMKYNGRYRYWQLVNITINITENETVITFYFNNFKNDDRLNTLRYSIFLPLRSFE